MLYRDVVYETAGVSVTSYVLGGTELLSQNRDGSTSYYLHDGQTSVRALADGVGVVTDTYDYSAYGELLSQSGSTANAYLYTGQQFDALTGQYYLRARYYQPDLGRFLSRDPMEVQPFNPIEINRYVYAANDPVDMSDPSGRGAIVTALQDIFAYEQALILASGLGAVFLAYTLERVREAVPVRGIGWPEFPLFSPDGTPPGKQPKPPSLWQMAFSLLIGTTIAISQISGGTQAIVEGEPQPIEPQAPEEPQTERQCDPARMLTWKETLLTRQTPNNTEADRYEIRVTGPLNYLVENPSASAWFDGFRSSSCFGLDAKYVRSPDESPYVPSSNVDDFIRSRVYLQENDLFRRYSILLADPSIPLVGLEVITNEVRSIPYWSGLIASNAVFGGTIVLMP